MAKERNVLLLVTSLAFFIVLFSNVISELQNPTNNCVLGCCQSQLLCQPMNLAKVELINKMARKVPVTSDRRDLLTCLK